MSKSIVPVVFLVKSLSLVGHCCCTMWLPLTLLALLAAARAHQTLNANDKQRLRDIFGDQAALDHGPAGEDAGTPDNTDCSCVAFSRCRVTNDSLYWDKEHETKHMSCSNQFEWCCEPSRVRAAEDTQRVSCGWSAADRAGDGVAAFGEFPWVVAILHKSVGETWSPNELVGGGSVIHPSVVLTAAHKVYGQDATKLKCRAGQWNASSTSERLPHQDRDVERIVKHESYYRPLVTNSIALIFLATPFDLLHYFHVGTACIGRTLPLPGTHCFGTGWGRLTNNDQGKYAEVMKKVQVALVDSAKCETELRRSYLGGLFTLHGSLTCAGGTRGADTCTGDGGAPLVCPIGNSGQRFAVFGMAAWGVGCGEDFPGVYVDVPEFYHWIGDVMSRRGYKTDSYVYKEA